MTCRAVCCQANHWSETFWGAQHTVSAPACRNGLSGGLDLVLGCPVVSFGCGRLAAVGFGLCPGTCLRNAFRNCSIRFRSGQGGPRASTVCDMSLCCVALSWCKVRSSSVVM